MGQKVWATKIKPPSSSREEPPESQPSQEEQPPNPQPSEPTPQAPAMISLDAMAEFLRLQDPTRNWAAELANFSRIGGQGSVTGARPVVTASETSAQPTAQPQSTMPTSPTPPQEEESPTEATPSEPSKPSPTHQETEPMDVDPISAYYDSGPEEREERLRKEKQSQEGGSVAEETPVAEPVFHEMAREEIDLNESARKQGLMTDEEFDAILNRVNRREDITAPMAESLDLASRAVGESGEADTGTTPEGQAY